MPAVTVDDPRFPLLRSRTYVSRREKDIEDREEDEASWTCKRTHDDVIKNSRAVVRIISLVSD